MDMNGVKEKPSTNLFESRSTKKKRRKLWPSPDLNCGFFAQRAGEQGGSGELGRKRHDRRAFRRM
jgi:hypothetical protein